MSENTDPTNNADPIKNQESESVQTPRSDDNRQTVTIEIVRHKRLFEILENPRSLWKVIASLFVIVVVLFVGLSCVVLVVKSIYPYNVIKTTPYGATIMKNEDKEVIYWLFNTAELWANSGIEVKKNDRITIRASGAANTAIHYLVDAANSDSHPGFGWVGTEGFERTEGHSGFRGQFRLVSDKPFGILLMQIIPVEDQKNDINWLKDTTKNIYLDGRQYGGKRSQIMVIGKERNDLVVPNDGILHFAANDVVMTDSVIKDMYIKSMETLYNSVDDNSIKKSELKSFIKDIKGDIISLEYTNSLKSKRKSIFPKNEIKLKGRENTIFLTDISKEKYGLGYYWNNDLKKPDSVDYPLINELIYYKQEKYRDPWFTDNVGSFLIVIERKNKKE